MTSAADFLLERYDAATIGALGNLSLSVQDRTMIVGCLSQLKEVVKFHKNWPVLVETEPEFEGNLSDLDTHYSMAIKKKIAWLTEQEYIKRFGKEPPTAPLIAKLLEPWQNHPDYNPLWGSDVVNPQ